MDVKIRAASAADAEVISYIHAASWKTAYQGIVPQRYLDELKDDFWVSAFRNWLGNNILTVQLIYENQSSVGCIAYGKARDDKYCSWGEIVSIYVLPGYFRQGYGQRLLEKALTDMKKRGYRNCYLWVAKGNLPARRFYAKNGFRCNNDECTCQIMQKQIIDVRYIMALKNYQVPG